MRVALTLSIAVALPLLGCSTETSPTRQDPTATAGASVAASLERDLTLQAPATAVVEVASAVELSRPVVEPRPTTRPRRSSRPAPAPAPTPDPVPVAAPEAEAAAPMVAEPAPVEDVVAGAGRELAPGKTVTIIPASSGPSSAPVEPAWGPAEGARGIMVGGHGDRCRPRGGVRGIGIAGRIPVGIPGRRLR
jgi:DNA polymerase-3 subunit gamma/tau